MRWHGRSIRPLGYTVRLVLFAACIGLIGCSAGSTPTSAPLPCVDWDDVHGRRDRAMEHFRAAGVALLDQDAAVAAAAWRLAASEYRGLAEAVAEAAPEAERQIRRAADELDNAATGLETLDLADVKASVQQANSAIEMGGEALRAVPPCGDGPGAAASVGPSTQAPSPSRSAAAAKEFDPFEGLPYEIHLPPDWFGAADAEDWAEAVAAFDARNPGALGADDPLRMWPDPLVSTPDLFQAFRTDGDTLVAYSLPLEGWTPERFLDKLEDEPDAVARFFYGYGTTPPLESDLTTARLTLPVGKAATISGVVRRVAGMEQTRVAYLIPIEGRLYFVEFDFWASQASTRMPQSATMMQSFRLREG